MKTVKVLGTGCKRCVMTAELIEDTAKEIGVEVKIEKVTDLTEIARLGVVSTPGVMVDGKVVHAGGIPKPDKIEQWLSG